MLISKFLSSLYDEIIEIADETKIKIHKIGITKLLQCDFCGYNLQVRHLPTNKILQFDPGILLT